jgi:hypothetical protein
VFEKSEISNGGLSEKVTKPQIGPIFVGQIRFAGDWCVFVSGGHFGPPESQTDLRDLEPCFPLQGIVLWGVKGTLTPVAQGSKVTDTDFRLGGSKMSSGSKSVPIAPKTNLTDEFGSILRFGDVFAWATVGIFTFFRPRFSGFGPPKWGSTLFWGVPQGGPKISDFCPKKSKLRFRFLFLSPECASNRRVLSALLGPQTRRFDTAIRTCKFPHLVRFWPVFAQKRVFAPFPSVRVRRPVVFCESWESDVEEPIWPPDSPPKTHIFPHFDGSKRLFLPSQSPCAKFCILAPTWWFLGTPRGQTSLPQGKNQHPHKLQMFEKVSRKCFVRAPNRMSKNRFDPLILLLKRTSFRTLMAPNGHI